MNNAIKALGLEHLDVDQRLELIDQLWESVYASGEPELTEAQREELQRRLEEHEANPEDVVAWEDIKADLARRTLSQS